MEENVWEVGMGVMEGGCSKLLHVTKMRVEGCLSPTHECIYVEGGGSASNCTRSISYGCYFH